MEDKNIIKKHFCYSFRVDIPKEKKEYLDNFIQKYKIVKYLGKFEKGTKTEKDHFQSIIWMEQKQTNNDLNKMRNFWANKTKKIKGGSCSLTSAKKIASLVKYCQKEDTELITNLTKEELKLCGKWETPEDKKQAQARLLQKLLYDYCETNFKVEYKNKNPWELEIDWTKTTFEYFGEERFNHFCYNFCHIYFRVYGTPCISRNQYIKWAWKMGVISTQDYLEKINVIKNIIL